MLYTIIEKANIEKCQNLGMCNCMCNNNILRWNNDSTRAIIVMSHECRQCSKTSSLMYTHDGIQKILKNDKSWFNKSI